MRSLYLILIIIITLTIRIIYLNQVPPSLFSDEVDIAYQVKVFKASGTDYYGNKFPIHFHSFSDWRTSLQIYSSVVVSYFTNNDIYIVRIPSAIYSTASVVLIYLITGNLYAAFLLAISPWSIHYGRTGFEVSGMLACILASIYFFKNKRYYWFTIFLCLSPYFYSTAKLFVPTLLIALILIYKKEVFQIKPKNLFILCTLFLVLLLPMGIDTIKGHSGFRFSYISVFSIPHREQIIDTLRYQDILLKHPDEIGVSTPLYSKILHNKLNLSLSKFIENYFASFSTNFLFIKGDNNIRHGFGNHGLLYIIDFFAIFIGIFIYKQKPTQLGKLFLWILLLAPIPFALTSDSNGGHSTRLILMLPSLIYFSALAVQKYKYLLIIYLILFSNFWHYYTTHYPQESAATWHYNMANAVTQSTEFNYETIYFSNKYEPFLPFFINYQPYFKNINQLDTNTSYFSGVNLDNKYYFGNINWDDISKYPKNSLFIIPENENNQVNQLKLIKKNTKKIRNVSEFLHLYQQ